MADPTYEILPAELDLAFIKGDEFGMVLSVNATDLTGYAYDTKIYSMTTVEVGGGLGAGVASAAGRAAGPMEGGWPLAAAGSACRRPCACNERPR